MEVYPESSSGGAGNSNSAESSGSGNGFDRQHPAQGVPQYVDMVIPDYESSIGESAQGGGARRSGNSPSASNETASDHTRRPAEQGSDEGGESDDRKPGAQGGSSEDSGVNPSDADVLLSVSGDHPGNKQYRAVVRHLAKKYTKVKMGYRNAAVQILMSSVKAQGGRFLKCSRDGKWKEVSERKAYSKACQAIRGTCRKVEVVSTRTRKRESCRRRRHMPSQEQRRPPQEQLARPEERRNDLEMLSLRLQTLDETLTHILLDLENIDHDYLFPFAKALDTNDLLRSMEVQLSRLSRTNANALAWGIKRSKGLKQIKLGYGKPAEKESSIVIAGIIDNLSVESLNLDDNDISSNKLKSICSMINENKCTNLQRLSLEKNSFGDEGVPFLSKLITSNKKLLFLNLAGNVFSTDSVNSLKAAAKKRTDCLFEICGLVATDSTSRKRPPPTSAALHPPDKRRMMQTSSQLQNLEALRANNAEGQHQIYASSQTQSSSLDENKDTSTGSDDPTGSDNPPSGSFGTDEGPTDEGRTSSINNDSDDTPGSSSS